jgi:hypothetical protein
MALNGPGFDAAENMVEFLMIRVLPVLVFVWIALCLTLPCSGAIYYIDADAADGGDGSATQPWNTLSDAFPRG